MIRKNLLIIFLLVIYIGIVTIDPEGEFYDKIKNLYEHCLHQYKKLDLEYHINKRLK
jgi:hypothetical protein